MTGGGAGIGRAATLLFATAGANVVIAARRAGRGEQVEKETNATMGKGFFVQADISDSNQIQAVVARA